MTDSLYLLGAPGVGKSTVLDAYLDARGLNVGGENTPFRRLRTHIITDDSGVFAGVYLGRRRDQFGGTDALSMAVAPDARDWARDAVPDLGDITIVGEGARLGNVGFLRALAESSNLTVVYLHAEPDTLTERRDARGSNQTPSWMRGAETGARNAFLNVKDHVYRAIMLDTTDTPAAYIGRLLATEAHKPR